MGLDLQVTPLGNGARVPSLYHDLPVSVITSNNSLKFLGGSGTNATAFFHIPTLKVGLILCLLYCIFLLLILYLYLSAKKNLAQI